MKIRCYNHKYVNYEHYGGRGITVCKRWLEDFQNFYDDMGPKPSKKHSLDRRDNDGNYCKENCRWATENDQHANRSDNFWIELRGRRQTLAQWSKETGIQSSTIRARLRNGWAIQMALTIKENASEKNFITFKGKTQTLSKWCKDIGIAKSTITNRIKRGWDIAKVLNTKPRLKKSSIKQKND